MIIKRHFQFDAAHMLSNYSGKCNNLHGHTYTGDVEISAEVEEETGMVLDYNVIKEVINEFDHAVIFSSVSEQSKAEKELAEWARRHYKAFIVVGGKCTAEKIAEEIAYKLAYRVDRQCKVVVWLHETPDSTARFVYDSTK